MDKKSLTEADIRTKFITPALIGAKAYEIYLCLYQAVTGTADAQNIYREFSPDFFDLVIVDECHRGSAADDAAWRQVLEYFSSATQIGLMALVDELERQQKSSRTKASKLLDAVVHELAETK